MSLTEPQASSDLALVRTRAEPVGDDTFKIFGTKVFIIWDEHGIAENIVHLVLARTPGAPEGVKGISLSVVPKFVVNPGNSLDAHNGTHCMSIEHKLGIKASPTAVLQFDDDSGAIGMLVGEESRGLEYTFIMMSAVRYAVGMQDVGMSERMYQKIVAYVRDHMQSHPVDDSAAGTVPIIYRPDVKRMLLTMRAMTEGARALAYVAAAACNAGHHSADDAAHERNAALCGFLVPIMRGWSTEMSVDVTSLGVQVHGDMGFIEEMDAAQFYRDARILSIYEDTTVIQANGLTGRKTVRDGGAMALGVCAKVAKVEAALVTKGGAHCNMMRAHLAAGRKALESVVQFVVEQTKAQPNAVFAGNVPYLRLCGTMLLGWQMARTLLVTIGRESEDPNSYGAKIATAHVFADVLLTQAPSIAQSILMDGETIGAVPETQL